MSRPSTSTSTSATPFARLYVAYVQLCRRGAERLPLPGESAELKNAAAWVATLCVPLSLALLAANMLFFFLICGFGAVVQVAFFAVSTMLLGAAIVGTYAVVAIPLRYLAPEWLQSRSAPLVPAYALRVFETLSRLLPRSVMRAFEALAAHFAPEDREE